MQKINILYLLICFNFRHVCLCVLIPGLYPAGHSGRVFYCNIVSGLNTLLAVSGHYNNYSDGVLSVLVLCQFQIVVYLELFVCWRRYCIVMCTMIFTTLMCVLLFVSEDAYI